jgi:hypothetical protein
MRRFCDSNVRSVSCASRCSRANAPIVRWMRLRCCCITRGAVRRRPTRAGFVVRLRRAIETALRGGCVVGALDERRRVVVVVVRVGGGAVRGRSCRRGGAPRGRCRVPDMVYLSGGRLFTPTTPPTRARARRRRLDQRHSSSAHSIRRALSAPLAAAAAARRCDT